MPSLPEFLETAATMSSRTVSLSGDSAAVLFSALAAIAPLWQWTAPDGLTQADIDYIDALLAKANYELMMPQIGQLCMYTNAVAPIFTLPCDGAEYLRVDYPDLYAALDSAYIVDADTFVTPALQSRSPIGAGAGAGLTAYSVNQIAGEELHYLSESETAIHSHGIFTTNSLAVAPGELPVKVPFITVGDGTATAGGGGGHNTVHPVNAVKFGIYFQ